MKFIRLGVLAAVGASALCHVSGAEETRKHGASPWRDLPNVAEAREVGASGFAKMQVKCEAVPGQNPRQADCTFTQASVMRPRPEATEARAATIKKATDSTIMQWCADAEKGSGLIRDEAGKQFDQAYRAACATKDVKRIREFMLEEVRSGGTTCTILMTGPNKRRLRQVDENTWRVSTEGTCGSATILVWRRKATDTLWNVKQMAMRKPNEQSAQCASDETTEWRWDYVPAARLGCDRFE